MSFPTQIALYQVFQDYYKQDPGKHAAPIPTAIISLPINKSTHRDICYDQRYLKAAKLADSDIRATAATIIASALELEQSPNALAVQRHNIEVGSSALRRYIIKRNHSGFARKVIQLTIDLSNWQHGGLVAGLLETGLQQTVPGQQHPAKTSPTASTSETETTACDALQDFTDPLLDMLASDAPATDPVQYAIPAAPDESPLPSPLSIPCEPANTPSSLQPSQSHQYDIQDTQKHSAAVHDPLQDAQQLLSAAERMLRESCGEDWLLQPLIPDMGSNEYRSVGQDAR